MSTSKEKYYTKFLETVINYNDHHNAPLPNEKLQQAIHTVMAETEEEERNIISDANNVTMYTFCRSPVTTNTQRKNTNVPS